MDLIFHYDIFLCEKGHSIGNPKKKYIFGICQYPSNLRQEDNIISVCNAKIFKNVNNLYKNSQNDNLICVPTKGGRGGTQATNFNCIWAGVDILFTCSIVFHTPLCSHNTLPQFHVSKKALQPGIFYFFHKKGTTRHPFSLFQQKRQYPPAIFYFFQIGNTRQTFFSFHKD